MGTTSEMAYFSFIIDMVNGVSHLKQDILEVMFDAPYLLDDNRIEDGYNLRYYYQRHKEDGIPFDINRQVSCLEVFAALALRIELDIMSNDDYGNRTDLWFSYMMLGLGIDNNSSPDDILQKMFGLHNKTVGLFPDSDPTKDLFDQATDYLEDMFANEFSL